MSILIRDTADYVAMPWRNGQGVATELGREDNPDVGFLWRLSRADIVASGPFSLFPGIDRILMLLSGDGFVLDFGSHGKKRLDRLHQHVAFAGDWQTNCLVLGGPCQDVNVMVDRQRAEATFLCHKAPDIHGVAGDRTLLHVLDGTWKLTHDGAGIDMPADRLVILQDRAGAKFQATGTGTLLHIDIRLKDGAR